MRLRTVLPLVTLDCIPTPLVRRRAKRSGRVGKLFECPAQMPPTSTLMLLEQGAVCGLKFRMTTVSSNGPIFMGCHTMHLWR